MRSVTLRYVPISSGFAYRFPGKGSKDRTTRPENAESGIGGGKAMAHAVGELRDRIWHWADCQECRDDLIRRWPVEEPSEPEVGQGWYDEDADCLNVWDGVEWVCVPTD